MTDTRSNANAIAGSSAHAIERRTLYDVSAADRNCHTDMPRGTVSCSFAVKSLLPRCLPALRLRAF
jgi:hypothetical protein